LPKEGCSIQAFRSIGPQSIGKWQPLETVPEQSSDYFLNFVQGNGIDV